MFRQQRTEEERGPIRRYKKVRPDIKRPGRSSQPVVRNTDAFSPTSTLSNPEPPSTADAGMGSGSSSPPPQTSSTPTGKLVFPSSASLRAARITVVPRNSSARTWILVVVFAIFIAGIAIPLISVGNTISSFNNGIQQGFGSAAPAPSHSSGATKSGGASKTSPAPKHVSYLTAAGARAGLAVIAKRAPGAPLSLVRIDATSISARARLSNGTSKLIDIGPNGLFTETTPGISERWIPIKQIKPSVVAKLVTAMRTHFKVAASRIDYMVLSSSPGLPIHWIVFTKAPSHPAFSASLSGGHLTRLP